MKLVSVTIKCRDFDQLNKHSTLLDLGWSPIEFYANGDWTLRSYHKEGQIIVIKYRRHTHGTLFEGDLDMLKKWYGYVFLGQLKQVVNRTILKLEAA